jgi:hypothetical protein
MEKKRTNGGADVANGIVWIIVVDTRHLPLLLSSAFVVIGGRKGGEWMGAR